MLTRAWSSRSPPCHSALRTPHSALTPAPSSSPHSDERAHRGGRIVAAGHGRPHEHQGRAGRRDPLPVPPRLDPPLGHGRNALGPPPPEPHGPLEVHRG